MLSLTPITLAEAKAFVDKHHRHHGPNYKWKFGVGISSFPSGELIGVAIVSRPVSRILDDGFTLEVSRCCTKEINNANSMLYGAAQRAAKALGYKKLITYILDTEIGSSLKASGFHFSGMTEGKRSWSTPSRLRTGEYLQVNKQRWEMEL